MEDLRSKGKPQTSGRKARAHVRRQFLVNAGLQFRLLIPIISFAVLLAFFFTVGVFYPAYQNAAHDPNPAMRALLTDQITSFNVRFWPVFLLAGALACLYSLFHSYRVAGPIHKLKLVLTQIIDGVYAPVKFRRGDELREFEGILTRLAQRMEAIEAGNVRKMGAIEKRINLLRNRLESENVPSRETALELHALMVETGLAQPPKTNF